MFRDAESYAELCRRFAWRVPLRFNIGVDVCDRWAAADPERLALIHRRQDGEIRRFNYRDLKYLSNRLANTLAAQGIGKGDRVGILLPQAPETAIAHIAVYKLGAIAVPLFSLFGPEALGYRLKNCAAAALITDRDGLEKVEGLRDNLPELRLLISVNGGPALDFYTELHRASDSFRPCDTLAEDPALIIYTSGTTGPPKGALHAHRVLLGHLPGVELPQELFPKPGDLFWTPADWAWIGGLLDVLLPSLHHGVPVLACRQPKFDPEQTFSLLAEFGVRNAFMPPTALKMMRQVSAPAKRWSYKLRSIGSGGETLGGELLDWGRDTFGLTINEFYGQTECNLIVSNCAGLMPVIEGAMGRAVPGHDLAVLDAEGRPVGPGVSGVVAVRRPDPVMFLGYWRNPEATAAKFHGDWLLTGDTAQRDDNGYFWFRGREDDIISSGGYRIGPGEIENCLLKHPAVALAAAVGVPDPLRGERVKAFLVLKPGFTPTAELSAEIQDFVRTRLAAYEYPRELAFVDSLPMTATGKLLRRELR